ncbi:hypothetical protein BTZ20_3364 [Rhodococcus sp. MTM3W5.2]|uniref:hypothetical protein n=1 Tax=Rhodococcus sp. MTM3W5.2 TaxID=1805827 RepID=UPI000979241E|nr:hypothetical protein [Rhodococcus sp. MTM3W5.2]AQA23293.1 hypothetical protein BTZ20_3364 [Rhodococcus sp. MTM3W5.2]
MTRTTRLLAGALATLALVSGLTAGTAAAHPAPQPKTVAPGTLLDFDGDKNWGIPNADKTAFVDAPKSGFVCTLGAVGTDSAGRKVGITAGHCNPGTKPEDTGPKFHGAPRGVPILENGHPVFDRRDVGTIDQNLPAPAPIGWIRWVSPDVGYTSTTDYMVIEFAPHVTLSSQVKDVAGNDVFKVSSLHKDAGGALTSPKNFESVENYGGNWNTNMYGMVLNTGNDGMFQSLATFEAGDSGGPVVMKDTNTWTGIITRTRYLTINPFDYPQWQNTSAKNILNNLNNVTPAGTVGRGFTITDN